jgi:tetratricopeptide (TPR) repeat protein
MTPKPDKSLYETLLSGYYQIEDFKQAADLLEKMIVFFPEEGNYWTQLAATYQLSKQYKKAVAMYELILKKGLLDETNTLRLVHLYLQEDLPYKAALLLNERINSGVLQNTGENLELLVNSWLMARENDNAITALSQLANIKNDPETYYRIGRLHFDQGNWEDAISSLEKATRIDKPDKQAESYLLMGIAAYHLNQTAQSSRALTEALSREITREQAQWWLNKLGDRVNEKSS